MAIPTSLALSEIATSANINSAPHRNNYQAIEDAVNALIGFLSGGVTGSTLRFDGTDWAPAGDAAWTAPTFGSSWADQGAPYAVGGYRKNGVDVVQLKGTITGGASGSSPFTLPAGYRPGALRDFRVATPGAETTGIASVAVATNGVLTVYFSAGAGVVSLDGISFLAEA